MTYEEAIKIIKRHVGEMMISLCDTDEHLEAEEMAIEALEKQIPKLPIFISDVYAGGEMVYDEWECPSCGSVYEIYSQEYKYCPNCGQATDWEVT